MNWLVIASGSDNDKLNKAKDFLLSKNGEDPNVILISENLDLEELQKNFRTVQKTTHCIVIGASSVFSSSDCVFLMGFLMGSQANLLIYDKRTTIFLRSFVTAGPLVSIHLLILTLF